LVRSLAEFTHAPKHLTLCIKSKWQMEALAVKIGYMRLCAAGPTLAEQQALLHQAGIVDFGRDAPVYVDKPRRGPVATTPERDKMVRHLRPGDMVVIAKASRLGTRADVLQAMAAIAARGASVHDAEVGEDVRLHPDAVRAIAFADRAESGAKRESAARMRARKGALGATGGRPEWLRCNTKAAAAAAWADLSKSARQVAEEFNVGARTLYRLFEPKGTPRFGTMADA
jgi:DNA invertase Pin-like site-specific DNA recombinase